MIQSYSLLTLFNEGFTNDQLTLSIFIEYYPLIMEFTGYYKCVDLV